MIYNLRLNSYSVSINVIFEQAPPQESWNGELLGYVVTWRETGGVGIASAIAAEPLALTVPGWGAGRAVAAPLRARAHYEIRVRAFNALGAGPPCAPLTASTLEGGSYLF